MKINSQEAREIFDLNHYVIFRNYLDVPDISLFDEAYQQKADVSNSNDSKPLGSMKIVPEYFFKDKNVINFYDECSSLYNVKTTLLMLEGTGGGSPTSRHSDQSDVIHWQCGGQSEWIFYDLPTKGSETKFIMNSGDVIWFQKDRDHSVQNLKDKVSIIFNEKNYLRDFIKKQYAAVGLEFI